MTELLITGGAGFIDRHLAQTLTELGHAVTVLDHFASANSRYGREWLSDTDIPLVELDVHDHDAFMQTIKDHRVIVHAASAVGVQETMDNPLATIEHLLPIRTLVTHATPDQTLVFLSSSDVYGMHSTIYDNAPMREHDLVVYEAPRYRVGTTEG